MPFACCCVSMTPMGVTAKKNSNGWLTELYLMVLLGAVLIAVLIDIARHFSTMGLRDGIITGMMAFVMPALFWQRLQKFLVLWKAREL
jgi:hypothetical protein